MGLKARFSRSNFFDPTNKWDPAINKSRFNSANGAASGMPARIIKTASPGNKMQVNVSLNNATAVNLTMELWNFINSFTLVQNLTYQQGNYQYIPQNSYEGIKRLAAGTDATVGFNAVGNCIIRGAGPTPGPADAVATISCKEIAYASFFQASGILDFEVSEFRYKSTNDAQKDEAIVWFKRTFSGGVESNTIVPRAYEKPTDQKENLINIDASFPVTTDSGIRTLVLSLQTVTLSLFIVGWTADTLT